jgi:hypothetical protein
MCTSVREPVRAGDGQSCRPATGGPLAPIHVNAPTRGLRDWTLLRISTLRQRNPVLEDVNGVAEGHHRGTMARTDQEAMNA